MESNITDQQYLGADLQLSEPHFDEEATLLSARPVVPLEDVQQEPRSGKRLAFGFAIVVAILAGAFGGAMIYRQRDQQTALAIEEAAAPVVEATTPGGPPVSGAAGVITDSRPSMKVDSPDRGTMRKVATTSPIRKSSPVARDDTGRAEGYEDSVQPDERDWPRDERMEERRLRKEAARQARREMRVRRGRSAEDLLRIREIFEGARRP